jgi:hypothetical protein
MKRALADHENSPCFPRRSFLVDVGMNDTDVGEEIVVGLQFDVQDVTSSAIVISCLRQ